MSNSADNKLMIFFFFSLRKQDLIFQANWLENWLCWKQFACNIKSCVLPKKSMSFAEILMGSIKKTVHPLVHPISLIEITWIFCSCFNEQVC